MYINQGIQIAQRQSLVTTDRVAAAVPASARDLFFPSHSNPAYYSIRFMGFPLRDPDTGTVTGQFPQGYPIWIAIAYGLDGVTGARRVTAWWAILGVLAVYFAAARLVGPLPAAAAAGLLCVHVIQTWYARFPNSEIVTQALVFAALLAHAYAHEDDDRFFGAVAASLLGLALFTRLLAVLVVGVAIAASLLPHVKGRRGRVDISRNSRSVGYCRGKRTTRRNLDRTSGGPSPSPRHSSRFSCCFLLSAPLASPGCYGPAGDRLWRRRRELFCRLR